MLVVFEGKDGPNFRNHSVQPGETDACVFGTDFDSLSNLFMFVSDASLSMRDDCRWSTQDFRTELPMF